MGTLDHIEQWQNEHGVSNAATADLLDLLCRTMREVHPIRDAYKNVHPNLDDPTGAT